MMRKRVYVVFAISYAVLAMFWGCGDDEETTTTVGPSATQTSTGPTTGTGSGTATSSTGMMMDCSGITVTDNAPCNTCLQGACCQAMQQYQATMAPDALYACVQGGACQNECVDGICESGVGYIIFFKECADCSGENCCQLVTDCMENVEPGCQNCFLMGVGCENVTLDDQINECQKCNCEMECGLEGVGGAPSCGTGGAGGTPGTGGAGRMSAGGTGGVPMTTSTAGGAGGTGGN